MTDNHQWRVVPLSSGQLLDVDPGDILDDGLYRKCSTYRGGGGYDRFPDFFEERYGIRPTEQFIVQLFGCVLDCPYCYVTRAGVWGEYAEVSTDQLVDAFHRSGQQTFHLMGGAPAIYLARWAEIIDRLDGAPFHSDLLLTEHPYSLSELKSISKPGCLYAVDVKGLTHEEWKRNTRKDWREELFYQNMARVIAARVPCYVTYTNVDRESADAFDQYWLRPAEIKSYHIDLINYKAIPFVDQVQWGQASD